MVNEMKIRIDELSLNIITQDSATFKTNLELLDPLFQSLDTWDKNEILLILFISITENISRLDDTYTIEIENILFPSYNLSIYTEKYYNYMALLAGDQKPIIEMLDILIELTMINVPLSLKHLAFRTLTDILIYRTELYNIYVSTVMSLIDDIY